MSSLRSMDIIQGTPALRAHAMRGLVQAQGHEVQLLDSTEELCRMRGRRRGEDQWQTVTWTLDRAAKLGLTGKSEWKKQPGTMLIARATGEVCRLIASDVLYAMPYASEELDRDAPPVNGNGGEPVGRVTAAEIMGAAELATPAPPAEIVEPDPEPETAEAEDKPMSRTQQGKMHALFNEVDVTDRSERIRYVNEVLADKVSPDRHVSSSSELSAVEAGHVIDVLQRWADQIAPEDAP